MIKLSLNSEIQFLIKLPPMDSRNKNVNQPIPQINFLKKKGMFELFDSLLPNMHYQIEQKGLQMYTDDIIQECYITFWIKARDIEIVGFLWLQGGGDMKKVDVAKEYLDNLKSLVATIRKDIGVSDLPFIYGSPRKAGIPDDLSDLVPAVMDGRYPAAQWVLKSQFDAQMTIPNSKMIILRDIETHPANVHYNTAGQLAVGRMFAKAFLECATREETESK